MCVIGFGKFYKNLQSVKVMSDWVEDFRNSIKVICFQIKMSLSEFIIILKSSVFGWLSS